MANGTGFAELRLAKKFLIAGNPEDVLAILPSMPESERRAIGGRARERVLAAQRAAELEGFSNERRHREPARCNICVTKD